MEYVYAKFAKKKAKGIRPFRISSDQSSVDGWDKSEDEVSNSKISDVFQSTDSSFYKLNKEIFETFIALYDAVPIIMGVASFYPNAIIEREIIDVFKKFGDNTSDNKDYVSYRLDSRKFSEIVPHISKLTSFMSISKSFPQFYILGLISLYDQFISNLVKAVIDFKPEIIFNSERSISFSDVKKFKSMDDLREHIIAKEIEGVLREGHESQLRWFSSKLGLKVEPSSALFSSFVELCERRNLFAHNGGYITEQYIQKCREAGCNVDGMSSGAKVTANQSYFDKSVETIIEISVQLIHIVWQKIDKEGGKEASKALINITYGLIKDGKYDLAVRIITFILNNKSTKMDDATRKMHIINCANAMKLAESAGYLDIVDQEDWSAVPLEFEMCVASIRDDLQNVLRLMDRVKQSDRIGKEELRDWPVFKLLRSNEKFSNKFESIFGEPLLSDVTRTQAEGKEVEGSTENNGAMVVD